MWSIAIPGDSMWANVVKLMLKTKMWWKNICTVGKEHKRFNQLGLINIGKLPTFWFITYISSNVHLTSSNI